MHSSLIHTSLRNLGSPIQHLAFTNDYGIQLHHMKQTHISNISNQHILRIIHTIQLAYAFLVYLFVTYFVVENNTYRTELGLHI